LQWWNCTGLERLKQWRHNQTKPVETKNPRPRY